MARDNRRRLMSKLFKSTTDNINIGKENKNKIDKLDSQVDELLYEYSSDAKKMQINNDEMFEKIKSLNSYNNIMHTDNIVEFLTQNTLINFQNNMRQQARINNLNKEKNVDGKKAINEMLANSDATQLLNAEKDRIVRYADYRLLDAYIPQVSRCINLFRDSMLSPDDNSKIDVSVIYKVAIEDDNEKEKINEKINTLKKELNFSKKLKTWTRSGLVDGDVFVSVLKYDNELNTMLLNEELDYFKPNNSDNIILTEEELFSEFENGEDDSLLKTVFREDIEAYMNTSKNDKNKNKSSENDYIKQIKKQLSDSINKNIICMKDAKTNLKYDNNFNKISNLDRPLNMSGCIVDTLPPESTLKLSLNNNLCLGYLYFEKYNINAEFGREGFGLNVKDLLNASMGGDMYMSSTSYSSSTSQDGNFYLSSSSSSLSGTGDGQANNDYFESMDKRGSNPIKDKFITDLFVKGISKKLDNKMIEDNQQFKEIIYQLVKQDYLLNKKVKIVYYAPEEVFHYAPDSEGIYGVSKLSKVYFYCKMLLSTLLTTLMQKISRGRDKRVLYVETGLDDDIEDSIQEVVRDYKAKEISSDVLKSVSTILRRIGAFEDYYIPRIDGEAPLDFETISGMDVNLDDEFIQFLLKSIISGMGVPATFADASNEIDFSRELIMQNSSFVREIVSMQLDLAEFSTKVFRKAFIYRYYDELGLDTNNPLNDGKKARRAKKKSLIIDPEEIEVDLPLPEFLALSTVMEQINNYQAKIDFVVQSVYPDDITSNDEKLIKEKAIFRTKYTRSLIKSIDWEEIENLVKESKMEMNRKEISEKANKTDDGTEDLDDLDDMGGL